MLYQCLPKLFAELAMARGDSRYARIMRTLNGVQLLILDDWDLGTLDAILDRIVHNAHHINLTGESLRRMRPPSTNKD